MGKEIREGREDIEEERRNPLPFRFIRMAVYGKLFVSFCAFRTGLCYFYSS